MTQQDEQIDSRPKYDVKIDQSQGVVIGDNARVEQHFHDVLPAPVIDLAAAEGQYRQWVVDRYNWLGFAGFEQADLMLTEVPLTKVFVRLSLTVEKVVRVADEEAKKEEKKGQQPQKQIVKVQEPVTLVEALKKNALVVGEPGAGKSTLLRWLAVTFAQRQQCATDRLGPEADADRLPVYVELGRLPEVYLRGDGGRAPAWLKLLPELIAEQETFDGTATAVLTQALADGRCLVLCDGLDEVADRTARSRIAQSLVEFARLPAGNRVMIGSRPAGMAETESSIRPEFERCQIERFAPAEVQQFLHFWYQLDTALSPQAQTASADELYTRLEHMPGTMKLATTPLLATILLLIWRNEGSLPARRVEVYERCCKMLVENWERHHVVQYIGALANLGWQRHLRLLAPLAYTIHSREQRTSATLQELVPVLAKGLIKEGLCLEEKTATLEAEQFLAALGLRSGLLQRLGPEEYGFPHLTFQEYLTARFIADQGYPDHIDLFMAHLHEGWWREVHLLAMGHLGSDEEGGKKASQLILEILNYNPPPWRILRPSRHALVQLIGPGKWLPTLQWQRRLAWLLGRELELVASGFAEMMPGVITAEAHSVVNLRASRFVMECLQDQARRFIMAQDPAPVLGQASPAVVGVLIRALADSDWDVQWAAAASLGRLDQAPPTVLDALIRALTDSDSNVQREAAASLGRLGQASPAVVDALICALTDCNSSIQRAMAASVEQWGQPSPAVVDAPIRALTDGDPGAREAASLGRLGQASPAVLTPFFLALGTRYLGVREAASLGRLGQASSAVLDTLFRTLANRYWGAREAAAASLVQLGQASPAVVDALIRALTDGDSNVQWAAAGSLGRLGQASPRVLDALSRALTDSDLSVQCAAAASLGQLGQPSPVAVDALIRALTDSLWIVQSAAAASLVKLGQPSPMVVDVLIRALTDSDWFVQSAAASLGWLGQASPMVVDALVLSYSFVRKEAAASLGQLGQASPAAVDALVRALADIDSSVREEAAASLGQLGQASPGVLNALIHALTDSSWGVRRAVAASLVKLGQASPAAALNALSCALTDSDSSVQFAAAASLGQLGQASPAVLDALIHALTDSDSLVREEAAASLGQLGQASPAVVDALSRALTDSNSGVRGAAAASLDQLGDLDEDKLRIALLGLLRCMHNPDFFSRVNGLKTVQTLLAGRPIPGSAWRKLQDGAAP